MRALVVLPTYDEVQTIEAVVRRIRTAVPDADVLVVDDSSPDGTADVADKLGDELGRVEVLRRPRKAGLGSAYRAGFRVGIARGYDVLVEMDSDLSHDPAALPDLLGAVASGADLAVGSRYVPGGRIPNWHWTRRAISRFGNVYARVMLRLPVHDATAGYRAYSSRALSLIDLERVCADGYGFQIEMAALVNAVGGRIVEVPIEFRDRELGTSKMSTRIVIEALVLVTWWGTRERLGRRRNEPAGTGW